MCHHCHHSECAYFNKTVSSLPTHTHTHRIGMESYSSSLQPYQVSSVCVCLPLSYFFISLSISGLCPPHQIWEIMVYEHKSPIPISLTGHFATEYNEWRRPRQRQRLRRRSTIIYVASNGTLIYIWLQQKKKKRLYGSRRMMNDVQLPRYSI